MARLQRRKRVKLIFLANFRFACAILVSINKYNFIFFICIGITFLSEALYSNMNRYTNAEMTDMHFMYGLANWNSLEASNNGRIGRKCAKRGKG